MKRITRLIRHAAFTFVTVIVLAVLPWITPLAQAQTLGVLLCNAVTVTGACPTNLVLPPSATTMSVQLIISNSTMNIQGSLDGGTNWVTLTGYPVGSSTGSTVPQVATIYRFNVIGVPLVRANILTIVTGTVTVRAVGASGPVLPIVTP